MSTSKPVVVYGASGYTGRLVPLVVLSVTAKVMYISHAAVRSRQKPTARPL